MKTSNRSILPFFPVLALTLSACVTAPSQAEASLQIRTYTAGDAGFAVNSHLIAGRSEAVLVDAQFTRSEATKVAQLARSSGRRIKTIFITHGHPDHYLGLEVLSRAFPQARIVATTSVIDEIRQTAPGKLAYWKPIYKDDLADGFILPQPVRPADLIVDGEALRLLQVQAGESETAAALYVPSQGSLVAGDLAYNGVHLWLAENRPEAWMKGLEQALRLPGLRQVLPGHGPVGGREVLEGDLRYIGDFLNATAQGATPKSALQTLVTRYPTFRLPIIAELSVGARLASPASH